MLGIARLVAEYERRIEEQRRLFAETKEEKMAWYRKEKQLGRITTRIETYEKVIADLNILISAGRS